MASGFGQTGHSGGGRKLTLPRFWNGEPRCHHCNMMTPKAAGAQEKSERRAGLVKPCPWWPVISRLGPLRGCRARCLLHRARLQTHGFTSQGEIHRSKASGAQEKSCIVLSFDRKKVICDQASNARKVQGLPKRDMVFFSGLRLEAAQGHAPGTAAGAC